MSKNTDISEYGGKGYSLLRLQNYGYNVPNFFIITSRMFKEYIKYNNFEEKIKTAVKENNYIKCQDIIKSGSFDNTSEKWILEQFNKLDTDRVSVRSSCAKEDGSDKSYAGQFYTGLFVNKDNLFSEIKICFASLYNKYVVNYADDIYNNFEMAVVVQKMIDSEYSGVAFSRDFLTINDNTLIIEVCKGIGENLVSGKTTPTKYYIRRKKNYIEYYIGDKLSIEKKIVELSKIVENIEKDYGLPVDIEWAISNDIIYILQTRPIVGFIDSKNQYLHNFSRPNMLGMVQLDDIAERIGMKDIFDDLYYFKPLFKFTNNHVFEVYYSISTTMENPKCMVNYINNHKTQYRNLIEDIYQSGKKLYDNLHELTKENIDDVVECYKKVGAVSNIINFFDKINVNIMTDDYDVDEDRSFKEEIVKYRDFFNDIAYKINDMILELSKAILPPELEKYKAVITLEELLNNKIDYDTVISRYNDGFIYYDGHIFSPNEFNDFYNDYNIEIVKKSEIKTIDSLFGLVAFPGIVEGKVKIIYSEDDFSKVEKGDIIVSPMTTPTFISLMKDVSGIVTDEGGTVCHAALIARELKKTCIVGTKNATSLLKDGMTIRVDGTTGKIDILDKE